MKSLGFVVLMFLAVGVFAQEEKADTKKAVDNMTTLHGYVVDQMCAKGMAKKGDPMVRAAKHTKECALEEACAASGYGLFYENGKWVKFDDNGDKLAKEMFEKSQKNNDFMADVTGEIKGGKFIVASLMESTMKSGDMKKASEKDAHDGHDHK